jgi:uncharacterized membrane protein
MLNNKSPFLWTMPPGWLRFFIIILLFLGIFFRFVNLDQKSIGLMKLLPHYESLVTQKQK